MSYKTNSRRRVTIVEERVERARGLDRDQLGHLDMYTEKW